MKPLTLGQKLDQRRFDHMSDKMAALVDYALRDQSPMIVTPRIIKLTVERGIVTAHRADMTSTIVGTVVDFQRNWANLIKAAELTKAEAKVIQQHVNAVTQGA